MKDAAHYSEPSAIQTVTPENLKILLWDIDGTLIKSTRNGSFKDYFAPVMREVFGSCGKLDELQVSGMTDFQIFYECLKDEGFSAETVRAKIPDLLKRIPQEMEEYMRSVKTHEMLEGVEKALEKTADHPKYLNALLTGNLQPAARIKLEKVGLRKYFDFSVSAFGEISHRREDLGFAAIAAASQHFNYEFRSGQFIIIGDTPNDIACARACNAKVLAVATGRSHSAAKLTALKPDALLENLVDTQRFLSVLELL